LNWPEEVRVHGNTKHGSIHIAGSSRLSQGKRSNNQEKDQGWFFALNESWSYQKDSRAGHSQFYRKIHGKWGEIELTCFSEKKNKKISGQKMKSLKKKRAALSSLFGC
jgi:hypothetical protein